MSEKEKTGRSCWRGCSDTEKSFGFALRCENKNVVVHCEEDSAKHDEFVVFLTCSGCVLRDAFRLTKKRFIVILFLLKDADSLLSWVCDCKPCPDREAKKPWKRIHYVFADSVLIEFLICFLCVILVVQLCHEQENGSCRCVRRALFGWSGFASVSLMPTELKYQE